MPNFIKNARRDDDLVAVEREPVTSFSTKIPGLTIDLPTVTVDRRDDIPLVTPTASSSSAITVKGVTIDLPTITASGNEAQPSVGTLIIGDFTTTVALSNVAPTPFPGVDGNIPIVDESTSSSSSKVDGISIDLPTVTVDGEGPNSIPLVTRGAAAASVTYTPTVPTAVAAASLVATTLAERFISISGSDNGNGDINTDGPETFNNFDGLTRNQKIIVIVCTTVIGTILLFLLGLCIYCCTRVSRREKRRRRETEAAAAASQQQQQQPYQYGAGYGAVPAPAQEARWKDGVQAPSSTYSHSSAGRNPFNDNYSAPARH